MVIIIDCMCNAHRLVCILSMNFSSGVCPSCMVNVSLEVFFYFTFKMQYYATYLIISSVNHDTVII